MFERPFISIEIIGFMGIIILLSVHIVAPVPMERPRGSFTPNGSGTDTPSAAPMVLLMYMKKIKKYQ